MFTLLMDYFCVPCLMRGVTEGSGYMWGT